MSKKSEQKKKSKQQKPKPPTVKTVNQPKPETPPGPPESAPATPPPVNLCDDCAYEFGACDGVPKFADEEGSDRVVECKAFVNVAALPTADEIAAEPAQEEPELVHADEVEGATEEGKAEDLAIMRADLPARPDPKRFLKEEDHGSCPSCQRPLKRTAFNRDRDAIRCVNPRCRQYRAVVRNIPAR